MAGEYIYKPDTRKGPVFIAPEKGSGPPTITLPDGTVITGVPADQRGGTFYGHEGYQYVFDNDVLGQTGAVLNFNGQQQVLGNSNMSYRGGAFGNLSESGKGAVGSSGEHTMQLNTGGGSYGAVPEFLGDQFPKPKTIKYKGLEAERAPYVYIDPMKFAESFGASSREEARKTFDQAKQFGLEALDTELQGLQNFVPKSAALGREQIALDNAFNQQQRLQQVEQALPGARQDLETIQSNARAYAQGKLPSGIDDRALEVGIRSNAADVASASGFGASSNVSKKASDLMSARERLDIAKYGEDLLSKNVKDRADLLLAPTEYANFGSKIDIMPSKSAAAYAEDYYNNISSKSMLSADNALTHAIDQSKFISGLFERNEQFNKTTLFNVRSANANIKNEFALSFFNYLVSFANSVAGAKQIDINTNVALDQQNSARNESTKARDRTSRNNTINSAVEALTAIGTIGALV